MGVLVEQFDQILLAGGWTWVLRHRPKTLKDAMSLMENYVAAYNLICPGADHWETGRLSESQQHEV